eukprot:NODE_67_length_25542_cov_1.476831.p17 type:complete len:213 gc:universal NODE_67_length_25542_cov_1.476831:19198-19836(+)
MRIEKEFQFPLEEFCIPNHYKDDVESVLIPHGLIQDKVEKLAEIIVKETKDASLVACCILKGAHLFYSDLLNAIKRKRRVVDAKLEQLPLQLEFIRVKSYHNAESTGKVEIQGINMEGLKDKHVLLVEDIVDTGNTMKNLLQEISKFSPKSVKVVSLLVKRTPLSNGYTPDYYGFSIPDTFCVGYCLDYNEYFRDLDHICAISKVGMEKYKQ